jgi:hypothetical protein
MATLICIDIVIGPRFVVCLCVVFFGCLDMPYNEPNLCNKHVYTVVIAMFICGSNHNYLYKQLSTKFTQLECLTIQIRQSRHSSDIEIMSTGSEINMTCT